MKKMKIALFAMVCTTVLSAKAVVSVEELKSFEGKYALASKGSDKSCKKSIELKLDQKTIADSSSLEAQKLLVIDSSLAEDVGDQFGTIFSFENIDGKAVGSDISSKKSSYDSSLKQLKVVITMAGDSTTATIRLDRASNKMKFVMFDKLGRVNCNYRK